VGGAFGVLKNCSNLLQRFRNRDNGNDEENVKSNPFDGTVNCFLIAWFIAGLYLLMTTDCSDHKVCMAIV
jgi:hypothetical protein